MSKGIRAGKGMLTFGQVLSLVVVLAAFNLLSGCKSPHPEQKKQYCHESRETEEDWPQEGGPDAGAPYRGARTPESQQRVSASTPTPTPNRPIDRPLDPTGLPVSGPTP